MAHKKAGGSTTLGRDSHGQRLGVKRADGQHVNAGMIIVRQRGTKIRAGKNVLRGVDDTLYAAVSGFIKFKQKKARLFNGKLKMATYANVELQKA